MRINCECQKYKMSSVYKDDFQKYRQNILSELIQLRVKCKALKNVFLISDKWKEFTYKALGVLGKEEGYHESVLLWSLRKDKLKYLTSPIHKFLLNENARDAYTNNINESWFLKESFEERQKEYYENYGKFYELLFAEWLQNIGWEITNLEAWEKNSVDVEAISPDNQPCAFEIKTYFPNIQALIHGVNEEVYVGCGENPSEIEEKCSQLISKAEKQLENIENKRKIIVIIDLDKKISSYNSLLPGETIKMLKTSMQNSDELWILKIDLFEMSRIY